MGPRARRSAPRAFGEPGGVEHGTRRKICACDTACADLANAYSREQTANWSDRLDKTAIIGALVLGAESGLAFAVGFIGAYGFYEYLHYTLHVKAPTTFYGRWARRHHFYHHFENPSFNHGVTSPLWDLVFGTYTNPGTVRVPRKFAMRWLINEEEAVWPNLVNDYSLKGRR